MKIGFTDIPPEQGVYLSQKDAIKAIKGEGGLFDPRSRGRCRSDRLRSNWYWYGGDLSAHVRIEIYSLGESMFGYYGCTFLGRIYRGVYWPCRARSTCGRAHWQFRDGDLIEIIITSRI